MIMIQSYLYITYYTYTIHNKYSFQHHQFISTLFYKAQMVCQVW